MRSQWIENDEVRHVLSALTTPNRLACEVSLATGLRINDCLNLKTEQIRKQRFTVCEQKTGKRRTVRIPKELQKEILLQSGTVYAFQGRLNGRTPRTRQAVFKDLQRASKLFRIGRHISPHTMRKIYAVDEYRKDGNLKRVQRLLNHSSEAVTMVYALADQLKTRRGVMKLPPS
jgi:integrase